MNEKDELLKQLANDFKQLTNKMEKDHNIKSKQLRDTLQVLEVYRNEYKKIRKRKLRIENKKIKEKDKQIIFARKKKRKYFTTINTNTTKKRKTIKIMRH